jgi:transposase
MKRLDNDRVRIQQILRGVRDKTVRVKLGILLLVTEAESTIAGCLKQGISRETFYKWLRKLRTSDFDPLALAEKSRRPKKSPRKISEVVELQVETLNKRHGHSDVLLAKEFEEATGVKLAHSTICKILKRRNRVRKYRTPKPNRFTRLYSMPNSLDRPNQTRFGQA